MRLPSFLSSLLTCAGLALLSASAAGQEKAPSSGFRAAGHAWTYNQGTVFEALEKTKAAGAAELEVYLMGQRLSADSGDVQLDENLSPELLTALQEKMKATGVRIINAYIGSKQWTRIDQNEADLRRIFEFGKKLGVTGFTGEPAERQWDLVEKLLKEFDLTFAIHNHINGFDAPYIGKPYRYWDPAYTFRKLEADKRDSRFGICLDTGHVTRSGLNALALLRQIQGRGRYR